MYAAVRLVPTTHQCTRLLHYAYSVLRAKLLERVSWPAGKRAIRQL